MCQVTSFVNKSLEMPLRVVSLDYLGVVAARLRKDAVQSNLKLSTIDQIINEIKCEELKDDDGNLKVGLRKINRNVVQGCSLIGYWQTLRCEPSNSNGNNRPHSFL